MFVCESQWSHTAYRWILAYLGLDIWVNMHLDVRASSPDDTGCTQTSIPALTFLSYICQALLNHCRCLAKSESGYMGCFRCVLQFELLTHKPVWDSESSSSII